MDTIRSVKKTVKGRKTEDGAGVKLTRVIGYATTKDFDPFLMLDSFDSSDPSDYIKGFPWHPHRGIETITYLIKGKIEHSDSLGNKGVINDGDCQWMTAGSGIIHQEMPLEHERMFGCQLWLNLPAKDKMTKPAYGDILSENIPVVDEKGVRIHLISGQYKGNEAAFHGKYVDADYYDIEMEPDSTWEYISKEDNNLFIYIMEGEALFDPDKLIEGKTAVLMSEGKVFRVRTEKSKVRFFLFSGRPLRDPIAWGGPIVMNTKDEIALAFKELEENKFIKKAAE